MREIKQSNINTRADQIIYSIKTEPDAWNFDGYNLQNKKKGIAVWMANGVFFIECDGKLNDYSCRFNIIEKWKLSRAFKWWQKAHIECIRAQRGWSCEK